MDWFRMYGDMPNDPKIGTLNDAEFRTWVELLCAACKAEKNGSTGLTRDTVNWALRRNVTETFQKLFDANLVRFNEAGEIEIVAWEKRQYASDSSTGRVKKYREKQKNQAVTEPEKPKTDETLPKRFSNGLEQNRTEQNIKPLPDKPGYTEGFARFWEAWPKSQRKEAKSECFKKWKAKGLESLTDSIVMHVLQAKESKKWRDGFEPAPLTYLNQARWTDEAPADHAVPVWEM